MTEQVISYEGQNQNAIISVFDVLRGVTGIEQKKERKKERMKKTTKIKEVTDYIFLQYL